MATYIAMSRGRLARQYELFPNFEAKDGRIDLQGHVSHVIWFVQLLADWTSWTSNKAVPLRPSKGSDDTHHAFA